MVLDILAQKGIAFSPAQKEALSPDPAPTLLLAVPGSGKTTVLVARVAALLESGADPGRICCLSYSRESAKDMSGRFHSLFGRHFPQKPKFSTIHSLCWKILNSFARQSGRPLPQLTGSEFAPASDRLLALCAREVSGKYPDEEELRELATKISLYKNRMLSPEDRKGPAGGPSPFPDVFLRYEARKKAEGLMDYDDMLCYTLDILKKRSGFCRQWQGGFDFWNVDEGQDLSPVQWALLTALVPNGRGLFLVGDEDQSIYGFRGADPEGLLRFPRAFPRARVLKMEENRRSRPEILRFCRPFIRLNADRYDKGLTGVRGPGGVVERVSPKNLADSYKGIAEIIKEMPGQTVGLLYRNNLTAWGLSIFLREQGIPFRLSGGGIRLLKHDLENLANLLRLCANPWDLEAFRRIDYRPDLDQVLFQNVLLRADGKKTVPQLLSETANLSPRGDSARNMAEVLKTCARLSPEKALNLLVERLAIGRRLRARRDKGEPLQQLRQAQFFWACQTAPDYGVLFSRLGSAAAAYRPEEAQVTLSTIHSAKGQEFDTVLLLDCFDGVLPGTSALSAKTEGDPGPYREEVRLFYVGATRAKERLFLFDPPEDLRGLHFSRLGHSFLSPPASQPGAISDFVPGEMLFHRQFGPVVLDKMEEDKALLRCGNGNMKTVSLSYCISRGLLQRIPLNNIE